MISETLEILKNNPDLFAWKLVCVHKNSYQLFFVKQELDMNREVTSSEYVVTIFTKEYVAKKEMYGTATFRLYSSMSEQEIKDKIIEQIELCHYITNPPYHFVKKSNIKPISKDILFDGYTLKEAAMVAADALFEADKYDKGYINSSEIYINFEETRFFDSNGNIYLYSKSYGNMEFVVTWKDSKEEIELYKFIEFNHLDSEYIQEQANKVFQEASNRSKAVKNVPIKGDMKVLLTNEMVKEYFNFFKNKACVDQIYQKQSDYKINKKIQNIGEKSDKISIRLEPTMKNSTRGLPFDLDGVVLKKLNIIEKGVVKNLWGSNNKSQYLSRPIYGKFENFVAYTGSLTNEELANENYLEVISVSSFDIDAITGDFGSEIRLAYLHVKGKDTQILTGGSISGSVVDSLPTVRFSNEQVMENEFVGPKSVLLEKVNIFGGK